MLFETSIVLIMISLVILILVFNVRGISDRKKAFGTIVSINGKNFTLKSRRRYNGKSTTYMIDASNAIITKNSNSGTGLGVAVGDTVMVDGMISGIVFTAKSIKDKTPSSKMSQPNDTEIY